MKYFLIHHGSLHTFDEYETKHKSFSDDDWIYYICDGSRHGADPSLLSETFKGACEKFVEHCLERIQCNSNGLKITLHRCVEQVDNIEVWSQTLLSFFQTLQKGE
jgi:hypothetical protein